MFSIQVQFREKTKHIWLGHQVLTWYSQQNKLNGLFIETFRVFVMQVKYGCAVIKFCHKNK